MLLGEKEAFRKVLPLVRCIFIEIAIAGLISLASTQVFGYWVGRDSNKNAIPAIEILSPPKIPSFYPPF